MTPLENIRFYLGIYNVPERIWQERTRSVGDDPSEPHARPSDARAAAGLAPAAGAGLRPAASAQIIFLDEPTSGVDPITRRHFWEFIKQLTGEGVTVFVTTHYMDEAQHCDRVVIINEGKIVAGGPPRRSSQVLPGSAGCGSE